MNYQPRPGDIAMDLERCFYSSMSKNGFENKNYKVFLKNAQTLLKSLEPTIKPQTFKKVTLCLKKATNSKRNANHRREDLLLASTLLLTAS